MGSSDVALSTDGEKPTTAPDGPGSTQRSAHDDVEASGDQVTVTGPSHKSYQFWAIMLALCITGLLGALENTVVTTSLPTIVEALQIGQDYIWITNVFFLTSALVQPLFGQLANIFGRRWLTMFIVALYTLGSGICGGANSGAMLIAGRAVQGIGSGGVNMIVDVIISDLVPLRERGNYIAIVLTVYAIGTSLGPFVGGIIVERTSWRWVFYINLPVGGAALVLLYLFLRVKTSSASKNMTLMHKLRRIDYIGNVILMGATVAILYALTYGGTTRPWTDGTVLAPLIVGLVALVAFAAYEGSSLPIEPVTPLRLFSHRTGAIVGINTFMNSVLLYWAMFFLPVYFQAVLGSSPSWSGVQLLPIVLVAVPGAIVSVVVLSKWGRYKELHVIGFAIETISLGLFSILGPNSSTAEWVIFQILAGLGSGMILNTLLPAFQAGIPEADQAAATASWAFIRSFGNIWGVAIPAAIFSNEFAIRAASTISEPAVRSFLSGGNSYQQATSAYVGSLTEPVRSEVISTYSQALKLVWYISVVFSGIAFVLSMFEKAIPLRQELETDFGLETEKKEVDSEAGTEAK